MDIDPKKLLIIDEFKKMAKGKSFDELLPLVMAVSQKSQKMGLSFSKDETVYLIDQLKESMSDKERSRVDMLLNMFM